MNNNTKVICKQMKIDKFNGEINDKELVLELLQFSTTPLLYMTEDVQKDFEILGELLKLTIWQSHEIFLVFMVEKYF